MSQEPAARSGARVAGEPAAREAARASDDDDRRRGGRGGEVAVGDPVTFDKFKAASAGC